MLALVAGLLSSCAASNKAAVRRTATSSTPLSKAAALAFAHAVNLDRADLPGFSPSSEHEATTARERRLEREMLSCVGPRGSNGSAGAANGLASASSKEYRFKHAILDFSVSSEVAVSATPAVATAELAAIRSSRVRQCFSHYLNQLFKGRRYSEASIGPVSIVSGTPPAPGTAGGFGWRIRTTLVSHQIELPLYMDVLGFVDGPSRVTLFSSGALRPFPAAAEQRLFNLLLARAKAHTP